ncbi:hypothetical protein [Neobacillus sp. PS2-9]|nr:hypothetical protein [Neobacillus sp. PS2-9]WML57503.1 hypothetical protein RCG25_21765 [Neobacillus sp. PS2-9]
MSFIKGMKDKTKHEHMKNVLHQGDEEQNEAVAHGKCLSSRG